ncbi:MAG TPA: PP2C family protein-serine/threonine phosphatase, partial [Bacteroidota bacterium]
LERKVADSAVVPSVSIDDARRLSRDVLNRFGALAAFKEFGEPASEKTIVQPHRSDYEFVWDVEIPGLPNRIQVKTLFAGNTLSRLETDFKVPEEFARDEFDSAIGIGVVVMYIAVIGAMIFFAFKRFRSFEIGFRLATVMGILAAVVMAFEIILSMKGGFEWGVLIAVLLGPLFVGCALVLVWAVSESVGREVWKEKFIPFDLLANGYLLHSRVGAGVVRGLAIGAGAMALWLLLLEGAGSFVNLRWALSGESVRHEFDVALPSVYVLGHSIYTAAFFFCLFVLFGMSFLRRWIGSPVLMLFLAALGLGLVRQGELYPFGISLVAETILAGVFVWTLYRFDALTSYLSIVCFAVIREGGLLVVSGHPTYEASGIGMILAAGALAVVSVAVQFRKNEIADFEAITPAFARHITERQRLQQEIEIARQVQVSFLPKENPKVPGLDIAARCVPALEVGGDYYDFIRLSPQKLAVVVGDVSGKGTQAAFYMTLAKGFLRALSDPKGSAKKVLVQMNKLFYDNVERGAFISMVYGVFDMGGKTLRLTRAGHNPILVWRAGKKALEAVQPDGLALGLEEGRQFEKTIEEVKIPFRKGDCFLFYTDGFTEAMNKAQEEYGDRRLADSAQAHAMRDAAGIIEGLLGDVRMFRGKARQHDDMTVVVVKIS